MRESILPQERSTLDDAWRSASTRHTSTLVCKRTGGLLCCAGLLKLALVVPVHPEVSTLAHAHVAGLHGVWNAGARKAPCLGVVVAVLAHTHGVWSRAHCVLVWEARTPQTAHLVVASSTWDVGVRPVVRVIPIFAQTAVKGLDHVLAAAARSTVTSPRSAKVVKSGIALVAAHAIAMAGQGGVRLRRAVGGILQASSRLAVVVNFDLLPVVFSQRMAQQLRACAEHG
jgi:hypothetical protein